VAATLSGGFEFRDADVGLTDIDVLRLDLAPGAWWESGGAVIASDTLVGGSDFDAST